MGTGYPKVLLWSIAVGLLLPSVLIISLAVADETGKRGPSVVMMDNIEGPLGAVRFDHELHTFIAGGCASCHHEHGSDNTICSGCHEIALDDYRNSVKGGFMACQNCHGGIDPEHPGTPSLKAALHNKCFSCHRGMGNVGRTPEGCAEQCHTTNAGHTQGQVGQEAK